MQAARAVRIARVDAGVIIAIISGVLATLSSTVAGFIAYRGKKLETRTEVHKLESDTNQSEILSLRQELSKHVETIKTRNQHLSSQVEKLGNALDEERIMRVRLEHEVEQEKALRVKLESQVQTLRASADAADKKNALLERMIVLLEGQNEVLGYAEHGEDHPVVVKLRREVEQLRQKIEGLEERSEVEELVLGGD